MQGLRGCPKCWGYLTPEREDTPHRRVRVEGRGRRTTPGAIEPTS